MPEPWLKKVGVPTGDSSLILIIKLTSLVWALLQELKGMFDALGLEDLPYASAIVELMILKIVKMALILTVGSTRLPTVDRVIGRPEISYQFLLFHNNCLICF